eukprot:576401-Rhodomonas_salina.3
MTGDAAMWQEARPWAAPSRSSVRCSSTTPARARQDSLRVEMAADLTCSWHGEQSGLAVHPDMAFRRKVECGFSRLGGCLSLKPSQHSTEPQDCALPAVYSLPSALPPTLFCCISAKTASIP